MTDKAFNSVANKGFIRSQNLHLVMDAVCELMEIKTPKEDDMAPIKDYLDADEDRAIDEDMFFQLIDHMITVLLDPHGSAMTKTSCREIKQMI